jgi:hypothetical protein
MDYELPQFINLALFAPIMCKKGFLVDEETLGTMLHRWESLVLPTPKAQCP